MHKVAELIKRSQWLRQELFEMVVRWRHGHIPSCYSYVEVLNTLYYGGIARYTPGKPDDPDRDRIIISKGHAAMAQYPILADIGYFPREELELFTTPEGILGMYADNRIPGIEGISGSLGHGIGMGSGFALVSRNDGKQYRTFVVVGDGECYEGSIWESAMFAAHHRLENLIVVVDRNQLCILGRTEDLVGLDDLEAKWRSFGWHAVSVDGHSYTSLLQAFDLIGKTDGKPLAIIANTVKGKGISFMEGHHLWHSRMPDEAQTVQARAELAVNPIID